MRNGLGLKNKVHKSIERELAHQLFIDEFLAL